MSEALKCYVLKAAEGFDLHIDDSSEDEYFKIKIFKGSEVVEEHDGVTMESVAEIDSDNFTAEPTEPPPAPKEETEDDAPSEDEVPEAEGVERDPGDEMPSPETEEPAQAPKK